MDQNNNISLKSNKNAEELVLNSDVYQQYKTIYDRNKDITILYYRCKYMRKKHYLCNVYLKVTSGVCDIIDDSKHTCQQMKQ